MGDKIKGDSDRRDFLKQMSRWSLAVTSLIIGGEVLTFGTGCKSPSYSDSYSGGGGSYSNYSVYNRVCYSNQGSYTRNVYGGITWDSKYVNYGVAYRC